MEIRYASNNKDAKNYDTQRLRDEYLIENLFMENEIKLVYSHIDRIIVGGVFPITEKIKLKGGKELGSNFFLERRELGVINIGGPGIIILDNEEFILNNKDAIYIGLGIKEVFFKSLDIKNPAKFYLNSAPAHCKYPTTLITLEKAKKVKMGDTSTSNKRTINQYIHPDVCKSCQLVMGMTVLEDGSVWNSMPTHTHDRRMEVYFYFDMNENTRIFHFMGEPNETRHIIMKNEEAVISPSWSIHSGAGTASYTFIWGMAGENQTFTDMDHIEMKDLR
ncbi:KduI/IolB family protein [Fusobacterium sp. CM21]|jgi:4-deoxy-L-threo-5-hexosulose-uronate ketol-isomerase|uniref:4-deoxy-L-threo-5-hexosulose-uronate ketol-isomerase n=1 Tax=Fusobacterium vincentii TaxID=155615 RepID=A0AAJ1CTX4_FUSVC|nr:MULTISPECIES: 5-dehydro-4-deoxy-D-glucuronate isomerase [Fusobacterium]ETS94288.1 KduI/IolB family protein [Fusobacterium sp. CM21]ERT49307.1 4-deoxy-L-threo-5-hexosulose-uronate ketol-isomerase [Fusobacterium nucleatum CTI-7]MCW0264158.1 5-dehydro-4-deoxy-D-glucuronate isomerase [Fusobacterium vincentii]MDH2315101.1 5-dehydro-4-deoxy-D-glucuronate isomerase [Fusobacterium nucleatum]OHU82234.1 5-dehydro-4-deoxy-D-glucuronate isomerase [Fusobacterium nucleatum]